MKPGLWPFRSREHIAHKTDQLISAQFLATPYASCHYKTLRYQSLLFCTHIFAQKEDIWL